MAEELPAVVMHIRDDGEIMWLEYPEEGVQMNRPERNLRIDGPLDLEAKGGIKKLIFMESYTYLKFEKRDGTIMRCVHRGACYWW